MGILTDASWTPPQGDCGSSRITRTPSRHRTEVSNCWSPPHYHLPSELLLNRQVSCSHLPLVQDTLPGRLPCSSETSFLGHASAPEDEGRVWLLPFFPQRLPGTWGHSEGENSQCPAPTGDTLQTHQASEWGTAQCPVILPHQFHRGLGIFFAAV